jgi:hypothetical protein
LKYSEEDSEEDWIAKRRHLTLAFGSAKPYRRPRTVGGGHALLRRNVFQDSATPAPPQERD